MLRKARKQQAELERLEQTLHELETSLRSLAGELGCVVYQADPRTLAATYVNGAIELVTGWSADEWLASPLSWEDCLHPEDRAGVMATLRAATVSRQPLDLEYRLVRRDGTVRWVRDRCKLERDARGRGITWHGLLEDITERRRMEAEVRESELRFRSALETMMDPFGFYSAVRDSSGRILDFRVEYVNTAACASTGMRREEQVGRLLCELMPAHRGTGLFDEYCRVVETGVPLAKESMQCRNIDADTHLARVFDIRAVKLGDGFSAAWRDMTERRRLEERERSFPRELVAAREHERKRIATALHHEAGSLAVGIAANLDTIEQDLEAGRLQAALVSLNGTRELFATSLGGLKRLALELRPPELDLLGLRAALKQHFNRLAEQTGVRVRFTNTLGPRLPAGPAACSLFRIVQEALTNAVTHGHARRAEVDLSRRAGQLVMTIRDDGEGFDPETPSPQPGTHLGLPVMRELAHSSEGTFAVVSRPGEGTTIVVTFPWETLAREARAGVPARPSATDGRSPRTNARRPASKRGGRP